MQLYSKILSLKSIQEVNEWDYVENKGFLKEFFYKKTMFKHSNGAIVISSQIIENIKRYSKKKFNVIKIPVLNDPLEYAPIALNNLQKYGLWMGLVDGYYRDVEFIAQGVIQAYRTNPEIKMLICGRYSKVTKDKIEHILKQMNVPVSTITFKGYLTDGVLKELCLNASFFVVPLWNNAKSNNRFPTKIATFLFCGKPIITSPIGEVGNYLNSKNSILIEPGDNVGLGESMNKVLLDENFTKNLALNALMVAEKNFNYKSYSENLLNFFKEIIYYDKNS
jgi:glycosyltransferase involved in cell wall biosynthesis